MSNGCWREPSRASAARVGEAPESQLNTDLARLRLIRSPRIGPVAYRQLIARFGSADAALEALPGLAMRGGGGSPVIADPAAIRREMAATAKLRARYLFLGDPDYPAMLAELENAPPALIVRGTVALVHRPCVALVGARNASAAACRFARQLAQARPDHQEHQRAILHAKEHDDSRGRIKRVPAAERRGTGSAGLQSGSAGRGRPLQRRTWLQRAAA